MLLPCRFQMHQYVAVRSINPVRDFVGPVCGVHFDNAGVVRYDVRDAGGNIVKNIDQLDVSDPINHHRAPARATRAQKEHTA